jgi:hypothetical protein
MKSYSVINSFDNEDRNRCVDIIKDLKGAFRFQEWRRDTEDLNGWYLMRDSEPYSFQTEQDAITAASASIKWFKQS